MHAKALTVSMPTKRPLWINCLITGFVYALTNMLVALLLGPLSRTVASWENLIVYTLTGALTALVFSPLIRQSATSRIKTVLAVWAAMVCVRSLGLGIEGALFKPAAVASILINGFVSLFVSYLVAWLLVRLIYDPAVDRPQNARKPLGWFSWVWRILVGGLVYFICYFVFGAANAILYTLSFYKNNPQYGLSLPPSQMIFLAQFLRGPLIALGLAFLARSVVMPRRSLALWMGLLLYVIGGVAPYIEVTFRTMPFGFNLATLTEILFQNILTGIIVTYLFTPKKQSMNQ